MVNMAKIALDGAILSALASVFLIAVLRFNPRLFLQDYPESIPCLLYRGQERLLRDGIYCVPCDAFLKNLHPNTTIEAAIKIP